MPDVCKHCGCTEIEVDPARGDSVCTGCGIVLAEQTIVNEVQFVENARGQSSAVGQFVSHDSGPVQAISQLGGFSRESRQMTLYKAKKRIEALATQLNLGPTCIGQANNFFRLCLNKGMTRGRKSVEIIGACVYLACRVENIPHMLIDVSDMLEIDVFDLGRTFLKIKTELCLSIPEDKRRTVDPSMYIIRFAHRLQFGDQTQDVIRTATRLVHRMMKDYVHVGRRPSGVSGAALIIAARYHNFNRTIQDVIRVVRVHESTLRKRLMEFGSTASSGLTPEEFMKKDLDESEDPPCFKAARRKEEEERVQKMLDQNKDIRDQFTEYQQEIERVLSERRKKIRGLGSTASSSPSSPAPSECSDREQADTMKFITNATMQSIQECLADSNLELGGRTTPPPGIYPSTTTMGLTQSIEESLEIQPTEPERLETTQLDLDGIDDDEIDSYILSDRERECKTSVWMKLNQDYLDEMEKKKEQERLEEEQREKDGKPPKKKKVYKKKDKSGVPARTAGEAMERLIKEKKLSNRIDYSVLKSLNGESEKMSETRSTISKASSSRSSRSSKKKGHPPLSSSFKEIMQSLSGQEAERERRQREEDDAQFAPLLKKQKLLEEERRRNQRIQDQSGGSSSRSVDDADSRVEGSDEVVSEPALNNSAVLNDDYYQEDNEEEEEEDDDELQGFMGRRGDDDDYYSD